jgi:hypothetical protein
MIPPPGVARVSYPPVVAGLYLYDPTSNHFDSDPFVLVQNESYSDSGIRNSRSRVFDILLVLC